jgi:hypothetical protein
MRHRHTAVPSLRLTVILALVVTALAAAPALAQPTIFVADLDGPSESPPNASPGTGFAQVEFDIVAHTMRVYASFSGLVGTTTNCHIHGPTTTAGTGIAGVMTTTPTFTGFPSGVTSGTYDHTFDMTQATSYNPSFVTAVGGTVALAEAALYQALLDGKAYFNVHSNAFPGGEIRGFLAEVNPTPVEPQTWGRIKSMYR